MDGERSETEGISHKKSKKYFDISESRNANFILIARRAIPSPLNPLNPRAAGVSDVSNLFLPTTVSG